MIKNSYKIVNHRYSPFIVLLYTILQGLIFVGLVRYGSVSTIRSCG